MTDANETVIDPTLCTFATGDVVRDSQDREWVASAPPEFPVTQWLRVDSDPAEIVQSDLLQSAYAPISVTAD